MYGIFAYCPRLGLIAEHGYWVKPAAAHRGHAKDRTSRSWDETNCRFGSSSEHHTSGTCRRDNFRHARNVGTVPPSPAEPSRSSKHSGSIDGSGHFSGGSEWILHSHNADLSWRDEVLAILENFTGRTPGSFLELKDR